MFWDSVRLKTHRRPRIFRCKMRIRDFQGQNKRLAPRPESLYDPTPPLLDIETYREA